MYSTTDILSTFATLGRKKFLVINNANNTKNIRKQGSIFVATNFDIDEDVVATATFRIKDCLIVYGLFVFCIFSKSFNRNGKAQLLRTRNCRVIFLQYHKGWKIIDAICQHFIWKFLLCSLSPLWSNETKRDMLIYHFRNSPDYHFKRISGDIYGSAHNEFDAIDES